MRRWIAACFLLLIAFYLGAAPFDRCDEGQDARGQVCHILCSDGCATAPIPASPAPPLADPLPRPVYEVTILRPVPTLEPEPEKTPPRV